MCGKRGFTRATGESEYPRQYSKLVGCTLRRKWPAGTGPTPSFENGVDEASQIRNREVAGAVSVGPFKEGIEVSG